MSKDSTTGLNCGILIALCIIPPIELKFKLKKYIFLTFVYNVWTRMWFVFLPSCKKEALALHCPRISSRQKYKQEDLFFLIWREELAPCNVYYGYHRRRGCWLHCADEPKLHCHPGKCQIMKGQLALNWNSAALAANIYIRNMFWYFLCAWGKNADKDFVWRTLKHTSKIFKYFQFILW